MSEVIWRRKILERQRARLACGIAEKKAQVADRSGGLPG